MTTVTVSYDVTLHAVALPRHWGPVDQANMELVDLVHHHGGQDWGEGRERSKRETKEDRAASRLADNVGFYNINSHLTTATKS